MAGPWYVDPENGSTTNNGLSEAAPWKLIPGQTGSTSQTGYGVIAGDTINVKNGTRSSAGRLVLPANNLTYRGYGVASNTLVLTLPSPQNPASTIQRRVARDWGSHEGMWTLYEPTETNSIVAFSTRSGCTIEDMEVEAPLTTTSISIGTSTSTAIGATVRRSRVYTSNAAGIIAYTRTVLIEDCEVVNIQDDAIIFGASTSNGFKSGYSDILRRVSIIEPGLNLSSAIGDGIQVEVTGGSNYSGALLVEDLYIRKSSDIKQAMVLLDLSGGLTLRRFHIDSVPTGHGQIMASGIGGAWSISDGYIKDGCAGNAAIRFAGAFGMATGSSLTIRNVVVDAAVNNGLFTWGGSTEVCTIDGSVVVENCTINGVNVQGLTYSAGISAHAGALVTLGANASLTARNNCITTTGQPGVRLPNGGANSAKWVIQNNCAPTGFSIGTTDYSTASAFQSAHSAASANQVADPLLTASLRPKVGSPLIGAGTHLGYRRDLDKKQRPNPPSIGAYDVATLRTPL